jgi:hypothetical protein
VIWQQRMSQSESSIPNRHELNWKEFHIHHFNQWFFHKL